MLVRRRLQAIKFSVIQKIEQPVEVLETYTISFAYHSETSGVDQGVSNENIGVDTDKDADNTHLPTTRCLVDIMKGIQQMDRLLTPLTATFTKLPSARALGVFLFYTDDCPEGYHAPDFIDAGDFLFRFRSEEDQAVRKLRSGGISTGHHSYVHRMRWLLTLIDIS